MNLIFFFFFSIWRRKSVAVVLIDDPTTTPTETRVLDSDKMKDKEKVKKESNIIGTKIEVSALCGSQNERNSSTTL